MDFEQQRTLVGEYGVVTQISHPIATVTGLPKVQLHEMVLFETGELGEVFLIHEETVSILVFSKYPIKAGIEVTRLKKQVTVPVGRELLGNIIDPFGNLIAGQATTYKRPKMEREIDTPPPPLTSRVKVTQPFVTGVTVIDMLVPLGKGQKELIIGDRKTGKTSVVLSTLKYQAKIGTIAIYAAIGKKRTDIKKLQSFLSREGIADKTIVVAATAYDSPSLIYITPYSAMAIAEWFCEAGNDVFIIFDDLTTHAKFYREISLLARRFPGRDSYPGDIFFTHARLMERSGNFKMTGGEHSITAFPIAEIVEGDFSGYIQTNIMGMTDGHIYFDSDAFYKGRRPAVNIELSVTRVGKQTQTDLLRGMSRELSTFLTNFEKMQSFSQFGAELTDEVKEILRRGEVIYSSFNQVTSLTVPPEVQLVFFCMIWLGYIVERSPQVLSVIRQTFVSAFEREDVKALFAGITSAQKFDELLENIQKNKFTLMKLAGLKVTQEESTPVDVNVSVANS